MYFYDRSSELDRVLKQHPEINTLTMNDVRKLRMLTGAGLYDCKKAIERKLNEPSI